MMKKKKLTFDAFDSLNENVGGQLVSGFSPVFEVQLILGGEDGSYISPNKGCVNYNCPGCSGGSEKW